MPLLESHPYQKISMPHFSLSSVDGKHYSSDQFDAKALLVMFICNHCPYVRAIEDRLINLMSGFSKSDLQMVAICSNDFETYVDDHPDELLKRSLAKSYPFPYLIDEHQDVARSFDATCTPDLFLFDEKRELFYHGRLDDSWKDPTKVTHEDLREAIKMLINDEPLPKVQHPSMGCSIKWKQKSS